MKKNICQLRVIHKDKISRVKKQLLDDEIFTELANIFKTLGDKTRMKILCALSKSELCVCDLSAILNMDISAVSHQLRILRNTKIVRYRREGKMVYYSLDDEHVFQLLEISLEHVMENQRKK